MHIQPVQRTMLSCSPCFTRPSRGKKSLVKVLQPCMPRRQLGTRTIQPSRRVMVTPRRSTRNTTLGQTLHHRCFSSLQSFRAASTSRAEEQNASLRVHELSLQLSQRPMNGNALMQYTLYNKNGALVHVGQLPKLGIADRYGLGTRNLRVFDLPPGGFPHILVRDHTILMHLFDLRLLVQDDQALLFHIAEDPYAHSHFQFQSLP